MTKQEAKVTIYIVIKSGIQEFGEMTVATTEKAFSTKEKAEDYIKNVPVTWTEKINNMTFYCERSIHSLELDAE